MGTVDIAGSSKEEEEDIFGRESGGEKRLRVV